ncbi:ABC transporter C-terminal domain-containing protein, partial [uncultured Roseivirga sp.]|uniref:ABC transporter C-terminal domain-containing protein n=1 Tax=uncultured Roseivirga sp. TaxID=543088 RepID=UPI0030DC971B
KTKIKEMTLAHIEKLEAKKGKLEAEMAKPEVFGDFNKLQEKQSEYDQLTNKLESAQSNWEKIAEMIDAIEVN